MEFLVSATSGTSVRVSRSSSDTLALCHPGANHTDACAGGRAGSSWAGRTCPAAPPSASHLSRDTVWGTDALEAERYPGTVLGSLRPPEASVGQETCAERVSVLTRCPAAGCRPPHGWPEPPRA